MSIGRKGYPEYSQGKANISSDDPQALEKLAEMLASLESETPKNSRKILYVKKRIAKLQRIARMEHVDVGFPGGRLLTNEEANRIQFLFDSLPDEDTIVLLKMLGFRSPNPYLWQAARSPKYLHRAYKIRDYIMEPYSEPDFSFIPSLRAQILTVYLQAIQDALGLKNSVTLPPPQPLAPNPKKAKSPASPLPLAEIKERLKEMDGIAFKVNGAQTASPVVWLGGKTESYSEAIQALGGRWSGKRAAWYIKPKKLGADIENDLAK